MHPWMEKVKWWSNKRITSTKATTTKATTAKDQKSSYSYAGDGPNLLNEIRKAHMEWQVALERMNCVVEFDEIDYAVYALEAAQRRYEMLLRQGKLLKLNVLEIKKGMEN